MGIAVSLLVCAAAAAQVVPQELPRKASDAPEIAVQAQATAHILAGVHVRFDEELGAVKVTGGQQPQLRHGVSGTIWFEFS